MGAHGSCRYKEHEDHNDDVEPPMSVNDDNEIEVDYEFHNNTAFMQIELGLKEADLKR
jgi:hypothetical protein